ncbi:MAG: DUF72 domain-containing protein [candidate division Zixibacteria bacterium]|nr:DUF72 domain-containing protein [candidate division Zixibacteria bacterium]
MIKIGTSGYSFADWVGPFYPEGIEKGKMLDFYKDHFDCVEVNSTYYRIPHSRVFYFMSEKTQDNFHFIVKANQDFTHKRDDNSDSAAKLLESVKPLEDAGKLKGILAQFPWSFKLNRANLEYLKRHLHDFGEHPLFVEFRHDSWVRPELFDMLKREGVGYCNVDEPLLKNMLAPDDKATTNTGYVRFHGRNSAKWWGGGGERYDYDYSEDELKNWVKHLRTLREKTDNIYLFFNNCHQGQAVKNAKLLKQILQEEFGDLEG